MHGNKNHQKQTEEQYHIAAAREVACFFRKERQETNATAQRFQERNYATSQTSRLITYTFL